MQVSATVEHFGTQAVRITWKGMKSGDVGEPVCYTLHQDRSVQVQGTFQGASVSLQGTNFKLEEDHFTSITDMRGNDLVIMSEKIEQIEDCTFAVRPVVIGGDPSTDLTVVVFARGGR